MLTETINEREALCVSADAGVMQAEARRRVSKLKCAETQPNLQALTGGHDRGREFIPTAAAYLLRPVDECYVIAVIGGDLHLGPPPTLRRVGLESGTQIDACGLIRELVYEAEGRESGTSRATDRGVSRN